MDARTSARGPALGIRRPFDPASTKRHRERPEVDRPDRSRLASAHTSAQDSGMARRRRTIDTSVPEDEVEVGPSRSEKRAARKDEKERLETLGERLTTMTQRAFESLALDEETVREVRMLASLGQGSALTQQRRRVARVLRAHDLDELERRVDDAEGATALGRAPAHRLERLRRDLLKGSDEVLHRLFDEHPGVDRQRLGQAVRAARKEAATGVAGRRFKELFKVMKAMGLGEAPSDSEP